MEDLLTTKFECIDLINLWMNYAALDWRLRLIRIYEGFALGGIRILFKKYVFGRETVNNYLSFYLYANFCE